MEVKRIEITKLCLACALLVVSPLSHSAQTSVQTLSTEAANEEAFKLSGSLTTYVSTGLQRRDSVNASTSSDAELALRLKISDFTYGFDGSVSKELTGQREMTLNNAALSAGTTIFKPNDDFSISAKLSATLPLSERSKDYQHQITGIGLSTGFKYQATEDLTISYTPRATLNFHEFKIAEDGTSNYQYTLANTLSFDYALSESFTLSAMAKYSRLTSYAGNSKDKYDFDQSISYDFAPYSVAIGHSIGKSPLAANGVETEIKLFDSNDSTIYGQFGFSF